MNEYEEKLKRYMLDTHIDAEQLIFQDTCHSVEEAAAAANVAPEDFIKSICMINENGELIVAIVKGENRASTSRVGKLLNIEPPRMATPEEIVEKTGYICGGVPGFGYEATFLIDPRVMETEFVYTGGGSPNSLTKISTKIMQQINNGQVVRIRK